MSTTPAAGWYSDPSNPSAALRWWDGTQWTAQTQPTPGAGPPSVSPYGGTAPMAGQGAGGTRSYAQAPAQSMPGTPMTYGQAPSQFPQAQFPQAQTPPYGAGMGRQGMGRRGYMMGSGAGASFGARNQASLTAAAVSAAYVLLAVTTHVVLLGIFPAFLCIRAFRRREPLAPLALLAALVAIGTAIALVHI